MMKPRYLCVSVHDVSPQTWPDCQRVMHELRQVADLPLGLLLVPCWHHQPWPVSGRFIDEIDAMRSAGHELVLHGHTHWDDGPEPRHRWKRFLRRQLTRHEGEFSALDTDAARRALAAGMACLAAHAWTVEGFVAPAWMLSAAALDVLTQSGLRYLGLFGGLLSLPQRHFLPSVALTYSSRHPAGDWLTRGAVSVASVAQSRAALLRLALHPADAGRPANLRHAQRLLESALKTRIPTTEAAYVRGATVGN